MKICSSSLINSIGRNGYDTVDNRYMDTPHDICFVF